MTSRGRSESLLFIELKNAYEYEFSTKTKDTTSALLREADQQLMMKDARLENNKLLTKVKWTIFYALVNSRNLTYVVTPAVRCACNERGRVTSTR